MNAINTEQTNNEQLWISIPHALRVDTFKEELGCRFVYTKMTENHNCPYSPRKSYKAGLDPVQCMYFILGWDTQRDTAFILPWDGYSSAEEIMDGNYDDAREWLGKSTPFGGWYGFKTEEEAIAFCEEWMNDCHETYVPNMWENGGDVRNLGDLKPKYINRLSPFHSFCAQF